VITQGIVCTVGCSYVWVLEYTGNVRGFFTYLCERRYAMWIKLLSNNISTSCIWLCSTYLYNWNTYIIYHHCRLHINAESSIITVRGGTPKNRIFFKKKIYLHFEQKTLNPLQNTLHWRQYTCPIFFPTVCNCLLLHLLFKQELNRSRDSPFSIVTGLRCFRFGVRIPAGVTTFSVLCSLPALIFSG